MLPAAAAASIWVGLTIGGLKIAEGCHVLAWRTVARLLVLGARRCRRLAEETDSEKADVWERRGDLERLVSGVERHLTEYRANRFKMTW